METLRVCAGKTAFVAVPGGGESTQNGHAAESEVLSGTRNNFVHTRHPFTAIWNRSNHDIKSVSR